MRATTRVGASICLSLFSLLCIILFRPSSLGSSQLHRIALGTSLENLPALWNWGTTEDEEMDGDGVRLVVFGDSWVDDSLDETKGKGRSWAEVLCEVINCTSHLNFAVSQAIEAYPSSAPTGAMTSNAIYVSQLATFPPPLEAIATELLPDLAAQIQQFITLPPPSPKPKTTLFVVSFGFWDVYNIAGLDFGLGQNVTELVVNEMFHQLDILYSHYCQSFLATHSTGYDDSDTNVTEAQESRKSPPFRVIIPKLFEPTLLPGWLSQRPVPLRPSSVAEHQKNAVYLSSKWNTLVEDRISGWLTDDSLLPSDLTITNSTNEALPSSSVPLVEKDIFYYDLAKYLLDIIVEHQLEDEGISDASGLGKGESPFESVYEPCVREAEEGEGGNQADLNGLIVCKEPKEYLFWDAFNLGVVAKEAVGREVGEMLRLKKSMKMIWSKDKKGMRYRVGS